MWRDQAAGSVRGAIGFSGLGMCGADDRGCPRRRGGGETCLCPGSRAPAWTDAAALPSLSAAYTPATLIHSHCRSCSDVTGRRVTTPPSPITRGEAFLTSRK